MTLYFRVPKPIRHHFTTGEFVEVCDRSLNTMSVVKIKRAGTKVVKLSDGRTFRASDGWWIGEKAWPFPSIRHQLKRGRRPVNPDVDEENRVPKTDSETP